MAEDRQIGPGLFVKLGLDMNGMLGGIGGVSLALNQTLDLFGKFEQAAQQLVDLANKAMDFQSEIDKLGVTTGMSSTELYKWSNVARYADSDIASLSAMLRKLSINMTDTGESGDKARAMLTAMHVSIKNADGSTRSMSDMFPDIIAGLNGIEDAGQKNTVAMALFGRSFQELSGYMLMSKEEIKGYFDSGWAPTEAQSQKLRDYEQATKDLNTATSNLALQGGSELSSSMQEWAELLNDAVSEGAPLLEFLGYLNDFLILTARGFHILGSEATAVYQISKGDLSGAWKTQTDLATWNQANISKDALKESGYFAGAVWDSASGKWVKPVSDKAGSAFQIPDTGKKEKDPNAMTSFEILRTQTEMDTLNKVTIPEQKTKLKELKDSYDLMGDKGSKAAKELKSDITKLTNEIALNINKVAEMTDKLGKAGAAVTASGGQTYNTMFASSLQAGGVGPDLAGYSDLANMSVEELQAVVKKGELGGSKGQAEKAQQYISMMGGKVGVGGSAAKTPASPADKAKTDTKLLDTELTKQGDAYKTLNDKIVESWVDIEKKGVVHWTAMSEMARIEMQKIMGDWNTTAKYVTETIAYNQVITVTDGKPAATPLAFTGAAVPVLKTIDFSGITFSSGGGKKDENSNSGSGSGQPQVIVQITNKDGVSSEVKSQGLAASISLKSGG